MQLVFDRSSFTLAPEDPSGTIAKQSHIVGIVYFQHVIYGKSTKPIAKEMSGNKHSVFHSFVFHQLPYL